MKEEIEKIPFKINKGFREIGPSGTKIKEVWCTVEGEIKEEVSEEFNKQWNELKNE